MRIINIGPDPSLAYRPNLETSKAKDKEDYRNFEHFSTHRLELFNCLILMQHTEWNGCNHTRMGMMDAIMSLDQLVDESDPDVDFPNSFHAFQTAEGIRQEHPDKEWFQLVGLIHDVGKIMALWDEPQWAVVGDTFPVGCKFQNSIVFRDNTFLKNPDDNNPKYNTEFGIYEPNCGLDNVLMSWGHDEYLYRVMKFNKCLIPEEFCTYSKTQTAQAGDKLCRTVASTLDKPEPTSSFLVSFYMICLVFLNWVSPGVQLYMSELTRKALKCLKNFCKVMKQKYREIQWGAVKCW
uniref:Inositol oxygenase n=1 Tax=Haplochromis burtoni TaxID=8153 RepID=A0A3Q2VZM0_HAPBU